MRQEIFGSQSLIHQVIYSVPRFNANHSGSLSSQSLIHQVIYSVSEKAPIAGAFSYVSIPYSSGHLFRLVWIRLGPIYSAKSLNPLFIRSSIPFCDNGFVYIAAVTVSIPYSSGHLFRYCNYNQIEWVINHCLNPLFIRSSIPFRDGQRKGRAKGTESQSLILRCTPLSRQKSVLFKVDCFPGRPLLLVCALSAELSCVLSCLCPPGR